MAVLVNDVVGDDNSKFAGPPRAVGRERLWFCALFFAGLLSILVGLRCVDYALVSLRVMDVEPLLQPMWSGMLRRWPWLLSHIAFGGVVGVASFLISCFYFTILDVCHSSTKVQKDWWPSAWDMLVAAVPQTMIYVGGNVLGYKYGYRAVVLPTQAPTVATFLFEMLVAFVVGDFFMYWEHRIMHTIPFLRKHIHSVHHAYHAPFGWAGGVVHPLEDVIVIMCQIATPILLGHHPLSFWTFIFIWTHLLIEEHSGHDVWWAPYNWLPFARCPCGSGAAPHDIHHYKVNKNYGFVLSVWDQLFDSAEPVVEPPDLPKARKHTWWEFRQRGTRTLKSD